MSLKGRLMPVFAELLTSRKRLQRRRARLERRRQRDGRPHTVTFYCQADDPYSYLLIQALPTFLERYRVDLLCRTVSAPPIEATPRPDLLAPYAFRDCVAIAPFFGLEAPSATPSTESIDAANRCLVAAEPGADYLESAREVCGALWRGDAVAAAGSEPAESTLAANRAELTRHGHYLSGMLHYEGEWYWGIDRLVLLEERLAELGVGQGRTLERRPVDTSPVDASTLDVYLSVRSPYSYIALDRVFALGRRYGIDVQPKPVLPMVKRGLPVPRAKRMYIVLDVKRIADREGIPFGRICDPLPSVERILSIFPYAERAGLGQEYLLSATTGAWAEGTDLSTDRGLRRIVERAGLSWSEAKMAMRDDGWRAQAAQNYTDMEALGFWGVPSFQLGDFATWGQDRIWLLEEKLKAAKDGE